MFEFPQVNTFERLVSVTFAGQRAGTSTSGSFTVEFHRVTQDELEGLVDENLTLSELVKRVVHRVSGIGRNGVELPAAEQLAAVLASPEACQAVRDDFFAAMAQTKSGKTSRTQRRTG